VQELKNVGSLNTKGVEFDLTYRASEGLTLHGAATYNRARYDDFFANCYRGQTQALGCSFVPVPGQLGQAVPVTTGNASLQNLAGTELARAPKFTGNVGLDFQRSLNGGKLKFGFGTEASYSDSMLTDYSSKAFARSPSHTLIDANIRIGSEDNRWEIALIGRNLTDKFYWTRNSDVPFSGTAPGNATGPSVLGDSEAAVSRGREVMLRLSTKF
jgi:iron complex outermembrane receptor protein